MLTVEPVMNSELTVGEYARVEWRTDLDVPVSEVEVEHGPDLEVVSDVEKTGAGAYAVRVVVGSIRTEVQFSIPGYRVERTGISACRALT